MKLTSNQTPNLKFYFLSVCLLLSIIVISFSTISGYAKSSTHELDLIFPKEVVVDQPIELVIQLNSPEAIAGLELFAGYDTSAADFGGVLYYEADGLPPNKQLLVSTANDGGVWFAAYSCEIVGCTDQGDLEKREAAENVTDLVVRLLPTRPGTIEVDFSQAKFVDTHGQPISVTILTPSATIDVLDQDGQLSNNTFEAPTAEFEPISPLTSKSIDTYKIEQLDLNHDGELTFTDVAQASVTWKRLRKNGKSCSVDSLAADINQDGCVDIIDLQQMAMHPDSAAPKILTRSQKGQIFTVNTVADTADTRIGDSICATSTGECSLRAALQEANAQSGPNRIHFNIPGGGVQQIQLQSRLPSLSDETGGTYIDGYTQPGSSVNTDLLASNAVINIEVKGNGRSEHDAFMILSAENTIRGLAIFDSYHAIQLFEDGAYRNVIVGNIIGSDATGTFRALDSWNRGHGVYVDSGASFNAIGRPNLADRNIIGGNSYVGIRLDHEGSDGNLIQNNIIGLNPSGTGNLRNGKMAIDIQWGPSDNVVGGTGYLERNVLSGHNTYAAMDLSHSNSTSNNYIIGNYIGTDTTGSAAHTWTANGLGVIFKDDPYNNFVTDNVVSGNTNHAIWHKHSYTGRNYISNNRVGVGADGSIIGNSKWGMLLTGHNYQIGPNNIFAGNASGGILINNNLGGGANQPGDESDENHVFKNIFIDNNGLSIDLNPTGVTLNDIDDLDTGPNTLLNFPVIISATTSFVSGTACANCTVEIYISDTGEGEFGNGRAFLDETTTDSLGNFGLAVSGLVEGHYLTATAIDQNENTSEFSLNKLVANSSNPTINPTPTFAPIAPLPVATPIPLPTVEVQPITEVITPTAGKFETILAAVDGNWSLIPTTYSYEDAVVTCSANYSANTAPVVVRVKNVASNSFEAKLQNPGDLAPVVFDQIHCLVTESGVWTLPDGRLMEAGTYNSSLVDFRNNFVGEQQFYSQTYSNPVVFGQVMSENNLEWSVFWNRGNNQVSPPSTSKLYTGLEVGEDTNTTRVSEKIGYIVFEGGSGTLDGTNYEVMLGADTIFDLSKGGTYSFTQPFNSAPVFGLVSQSGMDGGNGGWAYLHGATPMDSTSISLAIDEDQILDAERAHTNEQVSYAVFEQPVTVTWQPPAIEPQGTGRLETIMTVTDDSWTTVTLSQAFDKPVIACSVRYTNNTVPIVVRLQNVSSQSFEVKLQNPGDTNSVAQDLISCLITEEGSWTLPDGRLMEAFRYDTTLTDRKNSWVGHQHSFQNDYAAPVVLGQVMSYNDVNWSVFWSKGISQFDPPSSGVFFTGLHVGADPNTSRLSETIGYIVIDSGSGVIDGIEYEARLGESIVSGGPSPTIYPLNTAMSQTPSTAIVSQAGMNGNDASWAYLHTANALQADQITVSVDEEQFVDSERNHVPEQVGYVVFGEAVAIAWNGYNSDELSTYVYDSFNRTTEDSWGLAHLGGAYTMLYGASANEAFSTQNDEGLIKLDSGTNREVHLKYVNALNSETTLQLSSDQVISPYQDIFIINRFINTGAMYRLRVRILSSGQVETQVIKANQGSWSAFPKETISNLTYTANDKLNVKFQVIGQTPTLLRAKIWHENDSEPNNWSVVALDSTNDVVSRGGFGIRAAIPGSASSSVTLAFDNLLVTNNVPVEDFNLTYGDTAFDVAIPSEGSIIFIPFAQDGKPANAANLPEDY